MNYLFMSFLLALVMLLFFCSARTAIWAIGAQFLIAGLLVLRLDERSDIHTQSFESWATRIQLLDLLFVRSLLLPLLFVRLLKKLKNGGSSRGLSTIPANFVVWLCAVVLIIASYWFGQRIFPEDFQSSFQIGTTVAGVLIGFFILSAQSAPLGQIIGLLTLEAGIVLAEVLGRHEMPWFLQLGASVVFVWSLSLFATFLSRFSELEDPRLASALEKEVL